MLGSAEEELDKVQDTLDEFETALRCVVSRIAALRVQSGDIDRHLANRRVVLAGLQKAVDSVVVPTDLVEALTDGEINDAYCARVAELSRLLAPGPYDDCEMRSEVRVVSAMLASIAAMRIRDFLNAQLATLARPGTNAQIVQQSVLDRFRVLNHFLTAHAPHFAREIRDTYISTMGQTLNGYFYIYLNKMKGLTFAVGTRDDLLGHTLEQRQKRFSLASIFSAPFDTGSSALVGSGSDANTPRCSPFNLTISYPHASAPLSSSSSSSGHKASAPTTRLAMLDDMDGVAIIPHVAEQHHLQYPFEQVYRSAMHVLVDTVCAESLFHIRWFRCGENSPYLKRTAWEPVRASLINGVFKLPFTSYNNFLHEHICNTVDAMGLLLSLRVVEHMEQLLQRRGVAVPELTMLLVHHAEMLWHQLLQVLALHTQSLDALQPGAAGAPPPDTRPCAALRQYAEFVACVCDVGVDDRKGLLQFSLRRLRQSMDGYLGRVCAALDTARARTIFLVNNYSVAAAVFREHARAQIDDALQYTAALDAQKAAFVRTELAATFPAVVAFAARTTEGSGDAAIAAADAAAATKQEREAVEHTIEQFNTTWRGSLRQVCADIAQHFSDFALGAEILQLVSTQFTVQYAVLEAAVRRQQRLGVTFPRFQPLAAVTFEMKRVQDAYFQQ